MEYIINLQESCSLIYRRRHPEKTEYYRIIEANFEAFERNYPTLFENDYGYLRKEVRAQCRWKRSKEKRHIGKSKIF